MQKGEFMEKEGIFKRMVYLNKVIQVRHKRTLHKFTHLIELHR